MRKTSLQITCLFLLTALLTSCDLFSPSGTGTDLFMAPADDSAVPEMMRDAYRFSANVFALREIREMMPLSEAPVEIPADKVENYYRALIHVYNSGSAQSDTVTRIAPIIVFPDVELRQLIVSVEKEAEWTQPWRDGERLTGNPAIDGLMNRWDLHLKNYYAWSFGHAVVLEAPYELNMHALAKKFGAVEGVRYAEPNSWGGDGNNIRAEWTSPLALRLTYSLGYGDCPAGCINRRFWEFEVYTTGDVQFNRAYGSPYPVRIARW
jgi:hypothetical protein